MKNGHEIKIEKGIPIPTYGRGGGGELTGVLAKMEVGDSFWVRKPLNKVSGSVQYFCGMKSYSERFKLRTVDGGTRVWRIA